MKDKAMSPWKETLNPAWGRETHDCVLFKVEQDGPEVEAEEGVRVVGFVTKFLYLEVEGGQFKQTTVLPRKINLRNERQRPVSPKTFTDPWDNNSLVPEHCATV